MVNIDSDNGLSPAGTKPLPETILIFNNVVFWHSSADSVTGTARDINDVFDKCVWKWHIEKGHWVNVCITKPVLHNDIFEKKNRHDANFYVIGPQVVAKTSGASSDNKAVTNTTLGLSHYDGVIMNAMASQITSLTIVYSIVYSDADQRKYQSSASLAFVRGIHRGTVNSPHKWPVTWKFLSIWWRHHVQMRATD